MVDMAQNIAILSLGIADLALAYAVVCQVRINRTLLDPRGRRG